MAATVTEINQYLQDVRSAFVTYGNNLANAQRLGTDDLECSMMKFRVLKYLIKIVTEYFDSDDYENVNFFTTDEIRDVAQHINDILHTHYMIDF